MFGKQKYTTSNINQIPELFHGVFNPNFAIAEKHAEVIHRSISSQTVFKNKRLYNSLKYISLEIKDLDKFHRFDDAVKESLFCIASMNANGYVREKALSVLTSSPTRVSIPFIFFRLADWVLPVRQVAAYGVKRILAKQVPQDLIYHHRIVTWLLKVERTVLDGIYNEVIASVFSDENIGKLLEHLDSYQEGERYFIFKNVIALVKYNDQILDKLLNDKNYLIRLLAVRNINLTKKPENLRKLLKDKSQKVRLYAIGQIPKSKRVSFHRELNSLLFDNSAAIRATSRQLLEEISSLNYPEIYRERATIKSTPGSIIGLSEVGDEGDLPLLYKVLRSSLPRQRAAGLFAISNLNLKQAKEQAFEMLNDTSNTVKKTCANIIIEDKTNTDLERLRLIYKQGSDETKYFTLKIISQYGGWDIAGDLLKGIGEKDRKVFQTALDLFSGWYNYSVKLGIPQTESDRKYVLEAYKNLKLEESEVPYHVKILIEKIPFIFSDK